ncbi:hypothetical protein B1T49_14765 [Mycobacterium persicum]|nr:hypothetical protein B1T49_14765 [Mycobacterium persicum]
MAGALDIGASGSGEATLVGRLGITAFTGARTRVVWFWTTCTRTWLPYRSVKRLIDSALVTGPFGMAGDVGADLADPNQFGAGGVAPAANFR